MEAIIVAAINKISDPAVIVLIAMCAGLGYLHIVFRREDREDRTRMMDTLGKNTEVLNKLVNLLSAMTGKAL